MKINPSKPKAVRFMIARVKDFLNCISGDRRMLQIFGNKLKQPFNLG